ncbi:MAG: DUF262 domain-containing protein [Kiritimatiellae bacterium]|nr:DUF262 domain-containing protein [Kiritimatiellia bacterium]
MNYFVCTYGHFPEQDEMVERSLKEGVYLLHQYARYPLAIEEVRTDDVLLLNVRDKGIIAYAIASKEVQHIDATDEWNHVLKTKGGWHKGNDGQCHSAYGITWATLQGGQFSLVKKVQAIWAEKILAEMGWKATSPMSGDKITEETSYRARNPFSVAKELMEGTLEIPPVQRGVVWNATRLEVLWDSIMRNIPIGTFSIRASKDIKGQWNGRWELLDGQQRATAIMSAYRPFPPESTSIEKLESPEKAQENSMLAPVVWIDLMAQTTEKYGRKYIFRVTTGSQPWGYCLTDDETSNTKIKEEHKRDICQKYDWHNKCATDLLTSAVKPYPCELIPYASVCPVPFSLILKCCQKQKERSDYTRNPSLDDFVRFCDKERAESGCIEGSRPWNWFDHIFCDKVRSERKELEEVWNGLVERVYALDDYLILQVNAKSVDDVGTYFRRIGRGGVTPSQEEMNYSMLKAKLPSLKLCMEQVSAAGWASPSRMAMLALRTWQERMSGANGSIETLVNNICANPELAKSFASYTSAGDGGSPSFQKDLEALDKLLGVNNGGLLPWHKMILCDRSNGEICRYFLRLIASGRIGSDKINYAGLAAFLLYCSDAPERVILHHLNKKSSIHEGITSAYRDSYWGRALLRRLVFPEEIDHLLSKVDCDDWLGAWERMKSDPVWLSVVHAITTGYGSTAAYSVLLFGCRRFINSVFPNYNALLPIWSEENCPWDYDHIFPKGKEGKMAKGSEDVLHSIGNLAPLPFSLNRSKHDELPSVAYPLENCAEIGDIQQRKLLEYKESLMLMGENGEAYDYSNFSQGDSVNTKEVFIQTIRRFSYLYRDWFETLELQSVIPTSTDRKELFDGLNSLLADDGFSIWIPSTNGHERRIEENPFSFSMVDWIASSWISFGKCENGFLVAYGDDGQGTFATGVCKLPNQDQIPKEGRATVEVDGFENLMDDSYWYCRKLYATRPDIQTIKEDISHLIRVIEMQFAK